MRTISPLRRRPRRAGSSRPTILRSVGATATGIVLTILVTVTATPAIAVEPFHLFRYLDEQAFRYNHRTGLNDGQRFDIAVRQIVGKRLTWDQLTGKAGEPETQPEPIQ